MRIWQALLGVGVGCVAIDGGSRPLLATDVGPPADVDPPHYIEIPLGDRPATATDPSSAVPPESAEIEALVAQLGDPDFRRREDAGVRLKAAGPAALPALERARTASGDPEVVSRADAIIRDLQHPPALRRLPPGSSLGGTLSLRQSKRGGVHEVEVVERGGRVVRIRSAPDGIAMSVTGDDGKGKQVTRDFEARTPEQLQQQNPEAFELFQRWTGRRGAVNVPRGAGDVRRRWRGAPGGQDFGPAGPPHPLDDAEQAMVGRQLEQARADVARARGIADAQRDEMFDLLDQLRRKQAEARGGAVFRDLPPAGPAANPLALGTRLDAGIIDNAPGDFATGARVGLVMPGGRADRLGLKPFDVITSVNGRQVGDVTSLREALASAKPPLIVEATRDGKAAKFEDAK